MTSPCAFVLFGATGDLALRMLYPSLYFLAAEGLLPEGLRIVGTAREPLDDDAFAGRIEAAVRERAGEAFSEEAWTGFRARLTYRAGDIADPEAYRRLDEAAGGCSDRIYYLSTSPSLYGRIAAGLKAAGMTGGESRIVVEKPLGRDLRSSAEINDALGEAFDERRIFRIDHYLGKEAVQNLMALRFANVFFEPLWNKVSIDHVQITVAETVGVEGRWSYYDDYGAIRDMVQNHVLQLLALVAMEPPASLDPDSVRNEKVKVLRSLRPIAGRDAGELTVRGQYRPGPAGPGYTDEAGGKASETETFVAIKAHIDNWRWAGVPFYLRTGKRMAARQSEIVVQFKDVPHSIFPGSKLLSNRLVIRLQPEEEISLQLMNKAPTLEQDRVMDLQPLALNLSLSDAFADRAPRRRIAYERLLLEVIRNDPTLFVRRDEIEAAWRWVDQIVQGWSRLALRPALYAAGTDGPPQADALLDGGGVLSRL
jgi:glucose-6-phosphate 1-dehydrogenase